MSAQSNSEPPGTIPGVKPRWPWLFAITGVPTLLAAWVVWQQMARIDRLRSENIDVRSAKYNLDAEVADLHKQKIDLEKRLTAAEDASKASDARIRESEDSAKKLQEDAKKTQGELNALRTNARPYVTKPLHAVVKPIGFFTTNSWKIEWSLWVMNPSSERITVSMSVYCVALNEGAPVLNEWRRLKPVSVDATNDGFITNFIILPIQHCADGTRSRLVAFSKTGDAPAIPIDMWPNSAD